MGVRVVIIGIVGILISREYFLCGFIFVRFEMRIVIDIIFIDFLLFIFSLFFLFLQ
jgi:hypothetical protein